MLAIGAAFESEIQCHYIRKEREVVMFENMNTDGRTKRQAIEIFVDHIFRAVISNEVIYATNEVDTHSAILKEVPIDPRRQ